MQPGARRQPDGHNRGSEDSEAFIRIPLPLKISELRTKEYSSRARLLDVVLAAQHVEVFLGEWLKRSVDGNAQLAVPDCFYRLASVAQLTGHGIVVVSKVEVCSRQSLRVV